METFNQMSSLSDEEDDIEALRLAALQTLQKKKVSSGNEAMQWTQLGGNAFFNSPPKAKHKRGKFFGWPNNGTRGGRNTNNWTRNTNLIAVPMVSNEESAESETNKLILPQDRYCKTTEKVVENSDEPSSKFDRYNNSDDSDSDEEDSEEAEPKTSTIVGEIKKSSSLEALMEELENEIQGEKKETVETAVETSVPVAVAAVVVKKKKVKKIKEIEKKENLKPKTFQRRKWIARRPPYNNTQPYVSTPQDYFVYNNPPPPSTTVAPPAAAYEASYPQPQQPPILPPAPQPVYNVGVDVLPPPVIHPPPPLIINTDLSTTHLPVGQLSPRSAAFVMENRAIIEKRKRRSYSRSPSPRFVRRSKSPKRFSLSPSPKRRIARKSPSPVNQKTQNKINVVENNNKKVDPVLEARRKKFESKEITMKEGVIKLKKSDELIAKVDDENKDEVKNEKKGGVDIDEELEKALLDCGDDEFDLDLKVDLFSDEESDSDNEGRFKTKQKQSNADKVAIVPFSKLLNGSRSEIKTDLKLTDRKEASASSKITAKLINERRKSDTKTKTRRKPSITTPIDRKIEIKIRNPSKYDNADEEKKVKTEETKREGRKEEETEGDLRAQLSRKRAERQKISTVSNGSASTRILQDALEGAVFKKSKLSSKKGSESKDGKLPIHLRLGVSKRTKKQV